MKYGRKMKARLIPERFEKLLAGVNTHLFIDMPYMGRHSMLSEKKLRRNIDQCVTPHKVTQYIQLSGSQPEFSLFCLRSLSCNQIRKVVDSFFSPWYIFLGLTV